jgi:hypothetical protein
MKGKTMNKLGEMIVAACVEARCSALRAGKTPRYDGYGYTVGPKYIRVYAMLGNQRTVRGFIDYKNGRVYRAASWKAVGAEIPSENAVDCFAGTAF